MFAKHSLTATKMVMVLPSEQHLCTAVPSPHPTTSQTIGSLLTQEDEGSAFNHMPFFFISSLSY